MRHGFRAKFFVGREAELQKLAEAQRQSNHALIHGLPGVGKTHLAVEWIERSSLRKKIYWLTDTSSLISALQSEAKTDERALEEEVESWKSYDVIIWRGVHALAKSSLQRLFEFVNFDDRKRFHILISDEKLHLPGPRISLEPLNFEELTELVKQARPDTALNVADLYAATGGLPLLAVVNLSQHSTFDSAGELDQNLLLKHLSAEQLRLLQVLALNPQGFVHQELSTLLKTKDLDGLLKDADQRFLIETRTHEDGARYGVHTALRKVVLSSLPVDEYQQLARAVVEYVQDALARLKLVLSVRDVTAAAEILRTLSLSAIERASQPELEELRRLTENLPQTHAEQFEVARFLCRVYFLLGDRQKAIVAGRDAFHNLKTSPSNQDDLTWFFVLDHLQRLIRSGQTEEVETLIKNLPAHVPKKFKDLIAFEELRTQISRSEPRNLNKFEYLFQNLLQVAKVDGGFDFKNAVAHAIFQRGRIYNQLRLSEPALENFVLAERSFVELELPYQTNVCRINQAWILIAQYRWTELAEVTAKIDRDVNRYGYSYIRAGAALIKTKTLRHSLRYHEALVQIDLMDPRQEFQLPPIARVELVAEQIHILTRLGRFQKAHETLHRLDKEFSDHPDKEIQFLRESARQDLLYKTESEDDWGIPREDHQTLALDLQKICRLQRGQVATPSEGFARLELFAEGRLALAESRLHTALKSENPDERDGALNSYRRELKSTDSRLFENSALALLTASLSESSTQRAALAKAARASFQDDEHEPPRQGLIQIWSRALTDPSFEWESSREWMALENGEKDRWRCWLQPLRRTSKAAFAISTNHAQAVAALDQPPDALRQILPKGLLLDERLASLHFRGKKISTVLNKPVLRKLLTAFLLHPETPTHKQDLAAALWGEAYEPATHDARIYVNIQRLRKALRCEDFLIAGEHSYRLNPKYDVAYVYRSDQPLGRKKHQNQILIYLSAQAEAGAAWVSSSDLSRALNLSSATMKREIKSLKNQDLVESQGAGPNTRYKSKK